MTYIIRNDELYHHGILGQKWGVRRYQNPDGTLTEEGKSRYKTDEKFKRKYDNWQSRNQFWKSKKGKTIKAGVIAGSVVAASVLAAYGGLKLHDYISSKKEVTSVLEPWYKKNAEKIKMRQLEVYKKDLYEYMDDDWKKSNAQERYVDEIARGRKQIKELTNELFNYKHKYRTAKIKDRLSPSLFGSHTQFMTSPLDIWKRVHS